MADLQIIGTGSKKWENRHLTFEEDIDNLYDMWNADMDSALDSYNAMSVAIHQQIAKAIHDNKGIRALGGGWTWTKITTIQGGRMYNTKGLNTRFSVAPTLVPEYTGNPQDLLFVQCGVSIQELNRYLRKKNRSIKTSGASNGQTIAGAIATGTHGSALDFGAIPEFVVGLHILTGPDPTKNSIWLERKSYPVASADFAKRLQAQLLRDDDLFNAALVSFGSFGFIHGVMIETEPLYLLECHRQRIKDPAPLYKLMETLDFSQANFLPHGSERPHHFQSAINPYDLDNGPYITTMYKRPYTDDYEYHDLESGLGPGDDAPAFIGLAADTIPASVPLVVNSIIRKSYSLFSNQMGTRGEIFGDTELRGKLLSTALGLPLDQVNRVRELLLELNRHPETGYFTGVFAFRFVKASTATLGFTCFSPVTCVLELDGVYSERTKNFYKAAWKKLSDENIPFTFHWGKECEPNAAARLRTVYGSRIDAWLKARKTLLDDDVRKVFNNWQISQWGLDNLTTLGSGQGGIV